MKFVLCSNLLEHPAFPEFVKSAASKHPDAFFLITGDLLNVFPEPGEDLRASIFYELYGDMIVSGMDELVTTKFQQVRQSVFVEPLYDMFAPLGRNFARAQKIARARYQLLFSQVKRALSDSAARFLFIPGNMDYPFASAGEIDRDPTFLQLDQSVLDVDGIKIGGLGGIPNTAHPFRGVAEISPYEMHEAEYSRRLELLRGVDVLLTHLSPDECPMLREFLRTSPLQLLICRAPFNFSRTQDFRGELSILRDQDRSVMMVRPFDYPTNYYYVVDLAKGKLNPPHAELHSWSAPKQQATEVIASMA